MRSGPKASCPHSRTRPRRGHSAVHRHLLLPSSSEPSQKPPLEFVLIPGRSDWLGSPDAPRLLILGRAGTPQSLPAPSSLCFAAALTVSKVDPRQHPLAWLCSCALAPRSQLGDADSSKRLRRGNGSTGQECKAQTGCWVRFRSVLWIRNSLELPSRALLLERRAQNPSSRLPRPQAKGREIPPPAFTLRRRRGPSLWEPRSPISESDPPCF